MQKKYEANDVVFHSLQERLDLGSIKAVTTNSANHLISTFELRLINEI